jgi:signal transduction histidine kinase
MAVQWLADRFSDGHGLDVSLSVDGDDVEPSDTIRFLLFQSIRELLVNIVKHAEASRVTIELSEAGGEARVKVTDDGKGFDARSVEAPPKGWGLFFMRERFDQLGGELLIESTPGNGTTIEIAAPMSVPGDENPGG